MSETKFNRREAITMIGAGVALAGSMVSPLASAQLAGQAALVTGCSSGFGRLTALELARAGFATFAGMRRVENRNAEAAASLRSQAADEALPLTVVDLDVRSTASVEAALAQSGPLSVLVNSAGYILAGAIELHDEADVRDQFDTNIMGYHRLIRAALPDMRSRGSGLVVQISSGLGRIVFPTQGWYVATKFAIEGMSEALAYELVPFGVDVSIVQPTQYPTRFLANGRRYFEDLLTRVDDERSQAYAQQIAMARAGLQDEPGPDPREVALAVRDLALMDPGSRPLRRVVSLFPEGLAQINAGLSAAQDAVFEGSPFAAWREAVVD